MDMEICDLYFEAISKLIGKENRRENLKQLRSFFNRFPTCKIPSNGTKSKKSQERRFLATTYCYRIAYIYRYSTCISSAVAQNFGKVLKQNLGILDELMKTNNLRICSLGGGSPSDVVAMVKVVESLMGHNISGEILVTVVDMDENWKSTCIAVLEFLRRFQNATWKINYIQEDVSVFGDKVTNAIKNSDIVSMVKFVSEYRGGFKKNKEEFKKVLFQKVYSHLQPGSMLFLLDCPHKGLIESCGGQSGVLPDGRTLLNVPQFSHKLEQAVLDRHFQHYDKLFRGANFFNTLDLCARAWIKSDRLLPTDNLFLKVLRDKYEDFRKCLDKKAQSSDDSSTKCWKVLFSQEMKKLGWNRKRIKRAILAAERDVAKMCKK